MRFAIWDPLYPTDGQSATATYHQHLDELVHAEACGFDHFWFFEHHLSPQSPLPSPNLLIAAAARETSRMRLGNMVHVLPFRDPLVLAEECAMLDVLTGGRLDVGVGRGLKPVEFAAFGLDQSRSREMFNEALAIMLGVWLDSDFRFEGEYFHVDKRTPLAPPLVQRPHPPLYISAQSTESIRWAAERDIPFGQIDATIDDCRQDQALYRDIQIASGHAPSPRLFLTREVYVAATDELAREQAYPHLMAYWQIWGRYAQFAADGQMPDSYDVWRRRAPKLHAMTFEQLIDAGLMLVGSPDSVARQIERHAEALDLEVLTCVFQFGSLPHERVKSSMRLFADEVRPRLAHATTSRAANIATLSTR